MAALEESIMKKIKSHGSVQEICDDFDSHYQDSVYPPKEVYGCLLLCAAIQHRHTTLVESLLPQQLYLGTTVMEYCFPRPLHSAVVYADHQLIKQLLDLGLDSNQGGLAGIGRAGMGTAEFGLPIEMAIGRDDPVTLQLLQPYYSPEKTHHGMSPIHYACKCDAQKCLNFILSDESCDINAVSNDGWTPLMFAAQRSPVIVKALLDKGAAISLQEPRAGHTALQTAVIQTRDNNLHQVAEIVRLLVEAGADVTQACSQNEENALTLLCYNLMPMALGSDWAKVDSQLHCQQLLQCAEFLLKQGVLKSTAYGNPLTKILQQLNSVAGGMTSRCIQQTDDGKSAILVVVEHAFLLAQNLIRLCIAHGVDVNCQKNRMRKTPVAQLVSIIEERLRHSHLAGNPYLAVRQISNPFYTNPTIYTAIDESFTLLVLHGSQLRNHTDRISLFTIVKVDFEQFSPFLIVYLNSLSHADWVNVMHEFLEFIKSVRETMAESLLEDLNRFSYTRTLKQMCRLSITQAVKSQQPTSALVNNIHTLPLPEAMKTYILKLS